MTYALTALQRVAAVIEETAGTALAAQRIVPHLVGTTFTETEQRQRLDEARGVLAYVDDVLTRRGSTLELQQELDWELCLPTLLCGIEAAVGVGGGPYTYTFRPGISAPKAKSTATWEVVQSDGAADHISRRFSNARPTSIAIEFQDGQTTRLNTTWMGQAAEDVAKANLNPGLLSTRRVVPAALWQVAINDTWAALGGSAYGNVRALSWTLTPGIAPSYHLVGRENLDMDGWYDGRIELALGITMDMDAAAAEEVAHWRRGDIRYVRLMATNGEEAGALRSLTIDQAVRIIDSPNLLGSDGEQATVEFAAQLRAPDDDNPFLELVLVSGLAQWNMAAPGVPTGLAVAAPATNTTLRATWAAPTDGGAVRDYSLRHSPGGENNWTQIDDITGTAYTITGLSANTEYDVQVRANNVVGSSAWTATATRRTQS